MTKKIWEDPNLSNLLVSETKEGEDTCKENEAKCFCEYYHPRLFGGCGGCKAPNYICKYTNKQPCLTPKCECGSVNPPAAS